MSHDLFRNGAKACAGFPNRSLRCHSYAQAILNFCWDIRMRRTSAYKFKIALSGDRKVLRSGEHP